MLLRGHRKSGGVGAAVDISSRAVTRAVKLREFTQQQGLQRAHIPQSASARVCWRRDALLRGRQRGPHPAFIRRVASSS